LDNIAKLEVDTLCVRRGPLRVVDGVSFQVSRQQIVGIVGLNGAGKSSLLSCLGGALPVESGNIRLGERDVTGSSSWERCKEGIVLIPERRGLFPSLSVLDNLLVGGHLRSKSDRKESLEQVFSLFPFLSAKRHDKAKELSGGQQQMVSIGRGLMAKPRILMLDEPSEGLAPLIVSQMFGAIHSLSVDLGLGVLLAEQNAAVADIADNLIFMRAGRITDNKPVGRADADDIAQIVFGQ